ncbi:MAG: NAD(+)/NADH kinase [Bacteroidales bacterium]|nr:NAD(+)/NADH kinase [Bacteroidales bacterium]
MKVAIHIKNNTEEHLNGRKALEKALSQRGIEVINNWDASQHVDIMISIGGDGTLLNAVHQIGRCGIPVVGINFGHLGFLTTAGREDIDKLADCLKEGRYTIEPRTMLYVTVYADGKIQQLSALNEVYLHRLDTSPLLHTQVEVDNDMVATYVADGIIVATPTGSTAYSLSCGGPILAPGSGSLVLTPIAAHTLTQRPVILSDEVHLRLRDEETDVRYTLGVDSYVCTLSGDSIIEIQKADYCTRLVRIEHQNFFSAIREKLMWGM